MTSPVAKKIVVVGGGVSAGYFARSVVAANRGSELTIISAENVAPYERPALTKAVLHAETPARLPGFHTSVGGGGERQTPEWYSEKGVTLKLGEKVVGWDAGKQTVTTQSGETTSYDKLVVAIGCTALRLPASIGGNLQGVHYVRDYQDALELANAMDAATKPVIIGGGYIGLEVAASLAARGMNPQVVLMEPHVMVRLWTAKIAAKYEHFFEQKGVVFHRNATVGTINSDGGKVLSVTLASGEVLESDLCVVGVGAGAPTAPFDLLASTSDPKRPGGIAVDHVFAASGVGVAPKTVYAVGDLAAFQIKNGESVETTRMEHVAHARSSAVHCAAAVLDDTFDTPYAYFPFFYSRVFEQKTETRALNWAFWGFTGEENHVVTVGDFAPKLCAFWIESGSIVGAMIESGSDEERETCKNAAQNRVKCDVEVLKRCASVEEAIELLK